MYRLDGPLVSLLVFFFFNDTATTEIYTLSLHDALPISESTAPGPADSALLREVEGRGLTSPEGEPPADRKSTRLNSSHLVISYAVFCLKKKTTRKRSAPVTTTSGSEASGGSWDRACSTA